MKSNELRKMTLDELKVKEADLRKELFNLKLQNATGQGENPMRIPVLRRDIARVLTIAGEIKREGSR